MTSEKECELKQLADTLSSNTDTRLALAKDKWTKEQDGELKRQIEAEVDHILSNACQMLILVII